jgi:glycosyltransferase involved in cell wall biosynthesis
MMKREQVTYMPVSTLVPAELKKIIDRVKPDVIHAHDMRASFVSALCCGSIPLVSHIHNNAYDSRGLSVKSIAYLLAGFKARHILWVSRSSYEGYFFHKLFEKTSSVLFNIIDLKQVWEKRDQDAARYDYDMIYIGRLTYQKDPQRLMRLCARLKESKPDVKLAVVGTGELEEETKALCSELGLRDNVQFLGFQSNPIKMIADSKALVLTSRWEGTPMCALEALALGTPVVSTPSDGMMDLIDNGVHGYLHEEDEDLARSLLKILLDPRHREELSRNAKEKSEKINDEAAYKQAILNCYR